MMETSSKTSPISDNTFEKDTSYGKHFCDENDLQCPFTWKPRRTQNYTRFINKIEDKAFEIEDTVVEFTLRKEVVKNLILCYEYANMKQIDLAFLNLEECKQIVNQEEERCNLIVFPQTSLKHVCLACDYFLLKTIEKINESQRILEEIPLIENMSSKDKAGIFGIQAAILSVYGSQELQYSVSLLEKAIELDPDCGEWHFRIARTLQRSRINNNPEDKEIEHLQRSVDLTNNPFYMAHLALCCQCRSTYYYFQRDAKASWWEERAANIFEDAAVMCPEHSYILGLAANGFLKMKYSKESINRAKCYIDEALKLQPNSAFLNYIAGRIYYKIGEKSRSKLYLRQAIKNGGFPACILLMETKSKEDPQYNPSEDIELYLREFKEHSQQKMLHALMGAYYYKRGQFNAAIKSWIPVLEDSIGFNKLNNFYSPWDHPKRSINFNEEIIKEIEFRIRKGSCNAEEKTLYYKTLEKYKVHIPERVESILR